MTVNYRNLSSLKAIEVLVKELCHFLDGWGDLDVITIESFKKQMTITIEEKECQE